MSGFNDVEFGDEGRCPDCSGDLFRPGPRGGLAQNVECTACKSRFNVTRLERRHCKPDYTGPLPIVWAQRIPSDSEWSEAMYPKVAYKLNEMPEVWQW